MRLLAAHNDFWALRGLCAAGLQTLNLDLEPASGYPRRYVDPRVALQNITATDSTLYCSAVKRLGLYHRRFGAPVPVFKALRWLIPPEQWLFRRRVGRVGLSPKGA